MNNADVLLLRDDGNLFPENYRQLINKHKKNSTAGTINTGSLVSHFNPC